jgi:hypothetical protein
MKTPENEFRRSRTVTSRQAEGQADTAKRDQFFKLADNINFEETVYEAVDWVYPAQSRCTGGSTELS